MKLVWCPETATKGYIDTVKACENLEESGAAELISAMAAGWNANFIVETWTQHTPIATTIGLIIATQHSKARHICILPNTHSKLSYLQSIADVQSTPPISPPEIIIGEASQIIKTLTGIDFLVVDCKDDGFVSVLKTANLSNRGAVLVCQNANLKTRSGFCWRSAVGDGGSCRVVRSVFLPVGEGVDIAHVATGEEGLRSKMGGKRRWIRHVDQRSGEEHVIRT